MGKTFLVFFLLLLFFFSASVVLVEAGDPSDKDWCGTISEKDRTGGLVPCGRDCGDPTTAYDEAQPCRLCHLFMMLDGWIDGLLKYIVPSLAALMIAIGGGMYIISRGDPEMLGRAKKLFTSVVIGLVIIYGAFLIIGLFLKTIGLADWTYDIYHNWWEKGLFEIPCP